MYIAFAVYWQEMEYAGILKWLWHPLSLPQGEEFLYHATEVKNIWLPMGEIFAN